MASEPVGQIEGEKEKFDVGMSDEDLLTQITKWENESDTFYDTLKRVWEQNLAYYKGIQTGVELITGKDSKAVENRVFMSTETAIPIATSRLPEIVVRTGTDDEVAHQDAQALQDVLGYHMERLGMQAMAERFVRDMIVKRYGVFKILWDKEGDDVGLRVIDPRRIRIPKYGKTIDDLAFIIEDLEMSYGQVASFFSKAIADKLTTEVSVNKARKATFSVKEVWTNEFVAWKAGNEILKKEKNEYFDFESDDNNFFKLPKKPYVIKSLFETEDSIIGDTDYIQQVIPIQDNINKRKRQIENIVARVSNPILLIDDQVMSEEQAAAITNEEGLILYGKDAANGTKIRFESPGQAPQQLFEDLESSRREFDNIWGTHSTTRGEREGRETLGGRRLLKESDLGRIDLIARQLERALDEVAEYWTQLIKLFYDDEKTFSILGEDGVRFVKNFTGKRVGKDVKPMVTTGSTLPKDEMFIHEEARLLWQLKAIGVRTFYKMLKLPNMSEAIDDFIQTQSGAIMQQGGGGGQPMVLPEQAGQQVPNQQVAPQTTGQLQA